MIGKEIAHDPSLSAVERIYVRCVGAPIHGLRVRFRRLAPLMRSLIAPLGAQASVIDVGCGTGVFTVVMGAEFPHAHFVGIDNSEGLIARDREIATRAGRDNVRFEVADALELPYHETFDVAMCIDNLEHIEDDRAVLRSIAATLRPGGSLLVHVPGYYRRWPVFGKRVNFDVEGHVRPGYTLEEIVSRLRDTGYDVEQAFYTYGLLETVSNNLSYKITGASRRNKHLYALAFPFLNALAYLGRNARPAWGAGVAVVARKKTAT